MLNIKDLRKSGEHFVPEPEVNVVIISNSVIKVNGKYIIRTGGNDWIRQDAVYTAAEIDAGKQVTNTLNKNRK